MRAIAFCPFCGAPSAANTRCAGCGNVTPGLPPQSAAMPSAAPPPLPKKRVQHQFERTMDTGFNVKSLLALSNADILSAAPTATPSGAPPALPPPVPAKLQRPRHVEKIEALGVGPVLASASLLAKRGRIDDALGMVQRSADTARRPQDIARLRLSLAVLKASAGRLAASDVSMIDATAIRAEEERASLAALHQILAGASAREGKTPDAKRAALQALMIGGSAVLQSVEIPPQARLGVAFAAGMVDEAVDIAFNDWSRNPNDAAALQSAATAFLRRAVMLEERMGVGLEVRREAWDRAIGVWGMICAPSSPFWGRFASARSAIYGKDVEHAEIPNARNAAKERMTKVIRDIEAKHRDAGRKAERAQVGRFVQIFSAEVDAAEKLWGVLDGSLGLPPLSPPLAFPCGPLGLDLLRRRDAVSVWLQMAEQGSSDGRIREMQNTLGALAEGWALLRSGQMKEAIEFARARHQAAPGDRDALRLLIEIMRSRIAAGLADDGNVDDAVEALSWLEPAEVPEDLSELVLRVAGELARKGDVDRARRMIQTIAAAQPGQRAWKECEAFVLLTLGIQRANADDHIGGLQILIEAWRVTSTLDKLNDTLRAVGTNAAMAMAKQQNATAGLALLESLGAADIPPLHFALAIVLNSRGVQKSNNNDSRSAVEDLERALTYIGSHDPDATAMVKGNLAGVYMERAAELVHSPSMRSTMLGYIEKAAGLGNQQAADLMRQVRVANPLGAYGGVYGRRY